MGLINKKYIIIGSVQIFLGLAAFAQDVGVVSSEPLIAQLEKTEKKLNYQGLIGARYQRADSMKLNVIQSSMVLGFRWAPGLGVQLVGLAQTGPYGKRFFSAIDFNDSSKNRFIPIVELHQLYLQKDFKLDKGTFQFQGGILGTDQDIGTRSFVGPSTAFGTNSYAEGVRARLKATEGAFSVTTGSVWNTQNGNLLVRERKWNYLELQVSRMMMKKILIEASLGEMNEDTFARVATEFQLKVFSEHAIRVFSEYLQNFDTSANQYALGVGSDLGQFLSFAPGRLTVDLRYAYQDSRVGTRGRVMNDLYLRGNIYTVALQSQLGRQKKNVAFVGYDFGDQTRFQVGYHYKFTRK